MKGLSVDENMSNLTSASSEISASNSATKNGKASTNLEPQTKRKRNLPGHPGNKSYQLYMFSLVQI
jgi:hypothetical protein